MYCHANSRRAAGFSSEIRYIRHTALTEVQLDRFTVKITVDYPTPEEELTIIDTKGRLRGARQRSLIVKRW